MHNSVSIFIDNLTIWVDCCHDIYHFFVVKYVLQLIIGLVMSWQCVHTQIQNDKHPIMTTTMRERMVKHNCPWPMKHAKNGTPLRELVWSCPLPIYCRGIFVCLHFGFGSLSKHSLNQLVGNGTCLYIWPVTLKETLPLTLFPPIISPFILYAATTLVVT